MSAHSILNLQIGTAYLVALFICAFAGDPVRSQDTAKIKLADYIASCVAIWNKAPDADTKLSALGLQNAGGAAVNEVVMGKTALRAYVDSEHKITFNAATTDFADGRAFYCDVNIQNAFTRANLDEMEKASELDGQIFNLGPITMGRWKTRGVQGAIFVKSIVSKTNLTLSLEKFVPAAAVAPAK